MRCQPQVGGACLDLLRSVAQTLEIEANTVTDNPLLVLGSSVLSGGNLFSIVGIEALSAAQAIDFRSPLKTSPELARAIVAIRNAVATLDGDRYMAKDLEAASDLISSGVLNASVSTGILPTL